MIPSQEAVTQLLHAWRAGDEEALHRLIPLVFHELRQLARSRLARETPNHTLQPTALVSEVYLRLVGTKAEDLENRTYFFAFAAQLMREILVDHARARLTTKRGGGTTKVSLDNAVDLPLAKGLDPAMVITVDEALKRLEAIDPKQSRIVELRYFSGLTLPEIATALGISLATVERYWSVARRWLAREISRGEAA